MLSKAILSTEVLLYWMEHVSLPAHLKGGPAGLVQSWTLSPGGPLGRTFLPAELR